MRFERAVGASSRKHRIERRTGSKTQAKAVLFGMTTLTFFVTACARHADNIAFGSSFDRSTAAELDHSPLQPVKLTGKMFASSLRFGQPGMLTLSGKVLWLLDFKGDPYLHAIDAESGAIMVSLGRRGEEAGEFNSATGISALSGDLGAVWAFDISLQRFVRATIKGIDRTAEGVVNVPAGSPHILRAIWSDDQRIMGLTHTDSARITFLTRNGTVARVVANQAILAPVSMPLEQRLRLSTGFRICSHPGGGAAVAFFGAGRIDLFDSAGTFLRNAHVPFASNGAIRLDSTKKLDASRPRYYYRDCAASEKYVFALFSGRSEAAYAGNLSHASKYIHVFEWATGNLVQVIEVDHLLGAIELDAQSATLFATGPDINAIYRYSLPPISR